ncbi:hypothetical protein A1F97_10732, partial [Pyrenophora tritici-repentis]
MARSVTTAFNNPEDDILQVELYKDNACTELYELQSQLTCIANRLAISQVTQFELTELTAKT